MAAKLKPSNNHRQGERNFTGSRFNFHTTVISEEDGANIISAINEQDENTKTTSVSFVTEAEVKKVGMLVPERTIDIPLEQLVEAPQEWNYFPLPNIEILKDIAKSIYSQGQLSPALVWEIEDNKYMILGGHTRFRILEFLKASYPDESDRFSTMKCHVYGKNQIGDSEAQYIIITNNMTQRARESTSIMVKSIVRAFELQKAINVQFWGEHIERSNEIVAKNFGISSSSVDRLYRLRNLIPELLEFLDKGEMLQSTALRLSMMPESVQRLCLDSGCYNNSIDPDREKRLVEASTIQDVKDIFEKTRYAFAPRKVYLDYEIPKEFEKLSIAASKDDMIILKNALKEASDNVSAESKKIILDLIK